MNLRILSGKFKGRAIHTPTGRQTRPTTSILRKAVFDILQPSIVEADFLDLFAGSGAMGIEALSRGAGRAVFVDNNRDAIRSIRKNLQELSLNADVYAGDTLDILKRLEKKNASFHIIYADPPYDKVSLYSLLLQFIDTSSLLKPLGYLFLESHFPIKDPALKNLRRVDDRRFGTSILHQYRRSENVS